MASAQRALRVLLVTEASSAGVGRHILDLAWGLSERGVDVHLAWSKGRTEPAFEERLAGLPAVTNHVIPMRRAPHPSDRGALRSLKRVLADHGPFDVVHGHSTKAGLLVRRLGAAAGQAKVAYTPHCLYTMNPDASGLARSVASFLERRLAPRTDALIAVSPAEARHAERAGLKPRRLVTIPNGVMDLAFYERGLARQQLDLPADAPIVGFLGRLSPQKDPLLLVETFARLMQRHPAAHLAVAGTGDLLDAARARAVELDLGARVHWLGHTHPEVLLPAVDVLCMSSRYEAMPYVMLEAVAAGVPLVTTRVGGCEVSVQDGVTGSICEVGDAAGLAAALSHWLSDDDARAAASRASLQLARSLDVGTMTQATLGLYEELSGVTHALPLTPKGSSLDHVAAS